MWVLPREVEVSLARTIFPFNIGFYSMGEGEALPVQLLLRPFLWVMGFRLRCLVCLRCAVVVLHLHWTSGGRHNGNCLGSLWEGLGAFVGGQCHSFHRGGEENSPKTASGVQCVVLHSACGFWKAVTEGWGTRDFKECQGFLLILYCRFSVTWHWDCRWASAWRIGSL